MQKNKLSNHDGFTLLELLITVSIAAILMSLAVPNLSPMIQNNRITSYTNEFTASLYLARSEAIKRGETVTVCKSSDGATCITTGAWEQGWISFADSNADAVVDSGEQLVRIHKPLPSRLTLQGNTNVASNITYFPTGRIATLGGTLTLCDDRSGSEVGRNIVLVPTGRFRIDTGITC